MTSGKGFIALITVKKNTHLLNDAKEEKNDFERMRREKTREDD